MTIQGDAPEWATARARQLVTSSETILGVWVVSDANRSSAVKQALAPQHVIKLPPCGNDELGSCASSGRAWWLSARATATASYPSCSSASEAADSTTSF